MPDRRDVPLAPFVYAFAGLGLAFVFILVAIFGSP